MLNKSIKIQYTIFELSIPSPSTTDNYEMTKLKSTDNFTDISNLV